VRTAQGNTPAYANAWAAELRARGLVPLRPGWDDASGAAHATSLRSYGTGITADTLTASAVKQREVEGLSEHVCAGPVLFYRRELPVELRAQVDVEVALTRYRAGTSVEVTWATEWFAVIATVAQHENLSTRRVVEAVARGAAPGLAASLDAVWRLGGWRAVKEAIAIF
jgi:hypothetical protein